MKCSVCHGIINNGRVKLFDSDVCPLCIKCIGELDPDNIFYDFYKDKIKLIVRTNLLSPLPQQP